MYAILAPTASCSATGLPHCSRAADHSRAIFRHHLPAPDAGRGQRQAAGVERGQGDLQAGALGADPVGGRDPHLVEAGDAVLDAAQAHEGVAVLHRDALGAGLHHEGADAALVALGRRHPGHDDEQVGDDAVGGPQLHAVQQVVVAVGHGGGGQPRRVGADVRLGEQEGADVGTGAARQEGVLLLLGAEHLQRLRYADRLVGREQGADRGAGGADHGQRLVVVHLGEAEAAVGLVDLHAEGAQLLQAADHLVGDARLALDQPAVDLVSQEVAEPAEERLALVHRLGRGYRVRVDQVEPEAAEEQFLGEAGLAPAALPGVLRHLAGFAFGDLACCCGCGHGCVTSGDRLPTSATCPYYPISAAPTKEVRPVR